MGLRLWSRRIGRIGATIFVVGLLGAVLWTLALNWRPSDRYPFQGIDVSANQGAIDWWTVRSSGADFAYLRATDGAAGRDPLFEANWAAVYATGMRRGALHRYSLCRLAADQANNFNTTVPRTGDALPAAVELDFDDDCPARPTRNIVLDEVRRYLDMVEAHTGRPVLIKISKRFDSAYALSAAIPRPIWAIQDFFPPDYTARPWRMWQASAMRRIDGIDGPVNWDVVAP